MLNILNNDIFFFSQYIEVDTSMKHEVNVQDIQDRISVNINIKIHVSY